MERVWKKTYTIFISTALRIKALGSRKKNCIKIIHHLHVLSHKGDSHRHTHKPTPNTPPYLLLLAPLPHSGCTHTHTPARTRLQVTHIHTVIIKHTHTHIEINLLPSAPRALYNPCRIHYSLQYITSHFLNVIALRWRRLRENGGKRKESKASIAPTGEREKIWPVVL